MSDEEYYEISLVDIYKKVKNKKWLPYLILALIILFSFWIRSLDIKNLGDRLLGLDPYVFYRYAKYIVFNGSLPVNDTMRYYPFGFEVLKENPLPEYGIVFVYYLFKLFIPSFTVLNAAQFYPPFYTSIALLIFYFLGYEIFKDNKKALLATLFLAITPGFLFRTMGGFSDKEALANVFLFATMLFFIRAWKYGKIVDSVLAGLTSGLAGLTWGGFNFITATIALFSLLTLIIHNLNKKRIISYLIWFTIYISMLTFCFDKYGKGIVNQFLLFQIPAFISFIFIVYYILENSHKIKKILKIEKEIFGFLKKYKIENPMLSLILSTILIFSIGLILFPNVLYDKIVNLQERLIHPIGWGRFYTSVVENQPAYFIPDWLNSFSYLFYFFFIGAPMLFYKTFKKKWLTLAFFIFIAFFIFSRFSTNQRFAWLNAIFEESYIYSIIPFAIAILWYSLKYKIKLTEKEIGYLFIITWFIIMVIGARGAIRILFVVVPPATLISGYFVFESYEIIKSKFKDMFYATIPIAISIILVLYLSYLVYITSSNITPSVTQDWINAFDWIKNNTPKDAVFLHWWDYGYWVQGIADRTTVLDGGNYHGPKIIAQHFFTSKNTTEYVNTLEYYHNPNYLLICSDDIPKFYQIAKIGVKDTWYTTFAFEKTITNQWNEIINSSKVIIASVPGGGGAPIQTDFIYNKKLYAKESTYLVNIIYPVNNDTIIQKPYAAIYNTLYNSIEVIPFKCVCYDKHCENITGGIVPGCSVTLSDGAIFAPQKTEGMLFTRLYVVGEDVPGFKLVYDNGYPISARTIYGSKTNIKIWKIDYNEIS